MVHPESLSTTIDSASARRHVGATGARGSSTRRSPAARGAAGLTQTELAGRIGTDQTVVNSWSPVASALRREVFARICQALGLTVSELYQPHSQIAGTLADLRAAAGPANPSSRAASVSARPGYRGGEMAKAVPTWEEIGAYSNVLDLSQTAIAAAIDLTAQKRDTPLAAGKAPRGDQFHLTNDSPHVVYELQSPGGPTTVYSPQFPHLAYRTKCPTPSMLEIATSTSTSKPATSTGTTTSNNAVRTPSTAEACTSSGGCRLYHENTTPAKHLRGEVAAKSLPVRHFGAPASNPAPESHCPPVNTSSSLSNRRIPSASHLADHRRRTGDVRPDPTH